jgi:hypothetical protein
VEDLEVEDLLDQPLEAQEAGGLAAAQVEDPDAAELPNYPCRHG